jgi:pimeloyl-ACP methyl ester carboxylesterase
MHIRVNGVRLFFDVEGTGLVPDGPVMREKPTLLLLHGGPGFDHSIYKPAYSALADITQIIYLDHRGNGRSEDGLGAPPVPGGSGPRRSGLARRLAAAGFSALYADSARSEHGTPRGQSA